MKAGSFASGVSKAVAWCTLSVAAIAAVPALAAEPLDGGVRSMPIAAPHATHPAFGPAAVVHADLVAQAGSAGPSVPTTPATTVTATTPAPPAGPATFVGEKTCAACHNAENDHFGHTTHAKIFRLNPKNAAEKQVCEACHGPGSKHLVDVTDRKAIIGFTREWGTPIAQQNAQCLTCHEGGQRIDWHGSIHQTRDLACSDCHNPMARFSATGLLKKASITETCYTCHQQQRAEFRKRSHMPVPEGKMSCEDCHNPHGSPTRPLLKAESVNQVCYSCHAEKRGPFIWEHPPVRENCMNCHAPHGSNQDKLLVAARPFLCQQCHTNILHPNDLNTPNLFKGGNLENINERVQSRSCQNCHAQIHGSNSPSGTKLHR